MSLHQIYCVDEPNIIPNSKSSMRRKKSIRDDGVKTTEKHRDTNTHNVYLINPEQFKIEVGNQIIVTAPGSEPLSERTYHKDNNESSVVIDD
jgi:hypothetical protein